MTAPAPAAPAAPAVPLRGHDLEALADAVLDGVERLVGRPVDERHDRWWTPGAPGGPRRLVVRAGYRCLVGEEAELLLRRLLVGLHGTPGLAVRVLPGPAPRFEAWGVDAVLLARASPSAVDLRLTTTPDRPAPRGGDRP
ncbi:hypothetical protein GCM10023340_01150 [Nocardioides marinquilinus]|uniref:Uncharacterized protein n=1 Tax=Nocardioides marinquilinus TaxID=1210400 RepID=A0ABP9P5L8_9ACTN